ncbi:fatty-acid amide hydrolase 1-like [Bradysia coprophila]|uniref:fatty-acid amide hydrolase 1-like n=1 Tax=Bradysia coprophila TaxID=38358 RepID=UPI00187DA686|nr:fatty-acid amide hydrolase 1-like [Bradysia coprophila]
MYPLLRLVVYWLILPTFGISQESDLRQISLPFQEDARIKKAIQIRQSQRSETFRQIRQSYTLDEAANEILKLPAKDLIEKLQLRSLNATQVLQAYMAKAITVQDKFNCITEFVPFALERAQNLDKLNAVRGPLHGIPVCVKDDHDVIVDTTMGLGKNLNMPASSNSVLTQTLFDLGAVIFCKTNIPQTVFRYSSDNPIYGETLHYRNEKLAPGGSSSGTASLLAGGGAVFATGTDVAGSVRIPSHFSKLCTIKPTQKRLSDKGIKQTIPKLIGGGYKALLSNNLQNTYDSNAVPIPWNDELFESKSPLKFGYYTSLSFFPAIGDTISTVLNAKKEFESLGHTFVPFKIENDWDIVKLMYNVVGVDYGIDSHLNQLFSNEPPARGLEMIRSLCGQPDWKRWIDYQLSNATKLGSQDYSARTALFLQSGIHQSRDRDVWDLIYQRDQLISKLLTQMQDDNLDLILAPVFPFAACRINDTEPLFGATEYTMIWNFVDFPAGVIPFGIETGQNIDHYDDAGDAVLRLAKESTKDSIGSPIGIQIIGKPFKEEQVLRALNELFNKIDSKK